MAKQKLTISHISISDSTDQDSGGGDFEEQPSSRSDVRRLNILDRKNVLAFVVSLVLMIGLYGINIYFGVRGLLAPAITPLFQNVTIIPGKVETKLITRVIKTRELVEEVPLKVHTSAKYKVKKGDNLIRVISSHYGTYNAALVKKVAEANPHVVKIKKLVVGQSLFLPEIEKSDEKKTKKIYRTVTTEEELPPEVAIISHKGVRSPNWWRIEGSVKNTGSSGHGFIKVKATFYDRLGDVALETFTYVNGGTLLDPGQMLPFEILETAGNQQIATYKINISYN